MMSYCLRKVKKYTRLPMSSTNIVSGVFLRQKLITKPNEHPGTLRSNVPRENGCISQPRSQGVLTSYADHEAE